MKRLCSTAATRISGVLLVLSIINGAGAPLEHFTCRFSVGTWTTHPCLLLCEQISPTPVAADIKKRSASLVKVNNCELICIKTVGRMECRAGENSLIIFFVCCSLELSLWRSFSFMFQFWPFLGGLDLFFFFFHLELISYVPCFYDHCLSFLFIVSHKHISDPQCFVFYFFLFHLEHIVSVQQKKKANVFDVFSSSI